MGRLSDKERSAKRPGRHERRRVKRLTRSEIYGNAAGAGRVHAKFGRKKQKRVFAFFYGPHQKRRVHKVWGTNKRIPSIGEA